MRRRGIFLDMVDLLIGALMIVFLIILTNAASSCIRGNVLNEISTPQSSIENQQELLTLLQLPVSYERETMSVANLLVKYYRENKERGKIKEFLQDTLDEYAHISGKSWAKDRLCWKLTLKEESETDILKLWGDCEIEPREQNGCVAQKTIIPLPQGSSNRYLEVHYANSLPILLRPPVLKCIY